MTFLLIPLTVTLAGCADTSRPRQPGMPYRTISTEPWRDTEAARQKNREGLRHLAAGDMEAATRSFKQALSADVKFGPAHNNLGKVYYLQNDLYNAAWEFKYAIDLLPRHAGPHNNLGLVLEASDKPDKLEEAVNSYREAVSVEPTNIEYRANLARALVKRGDKTDEVAILLQQILDQDDRPQWRSWAKLQLIKLQAGRTGLQPPS
jgi:Flp pilus assembly protein TadD